MTKEKTWHMGIKMIGKRRRIRFLGHHFIYPSGLNSDSYDSKGYCNTQLKTRILTINTTLLSIKTKNDTFPRFGVCQNGPSMIGLEIDHHHGPKLSRITFEPLPRPLLVKQAFISLIPFYSVFLYIEGVILPNKYLFFLKVGTNPSSAVFGTMSDF